MNMTILLNKNFSACYTQAYADAGRLAEGIRGGIRRGAYAEACAGAYAGAYAGAGRDRTGQEPRHTQGIRRAYAGHTQGIRRAGQDRTGEDPVPSDPFAKGIRGERTRGAYASIRGAYARIFFDRNHTREHTQEAYAGM